jgi:hypothetical protein
MEPNSSQDKAKRAAGVQAIATYLKNGMKIGLGSGTTSRWFIQRTPRMRKVPIYRSLSEPGYSAIPFAHLSRRNRQWVETTLAGSVPVENGSVVTQTKTRITPGTAMAS